MWFWFPSDRPLHWEILNVDTKQSKTLSKFASNVKKNNHKCQTGQILPHLSSACVHMDSINACVHKRKEHAYMEAMFRIAGTKPSIWLLRNPGRNVIYSYKVSSIDLLRNSGTHWTWLFFNATWKMKDLRCYTTKWCRSDYANAVGNTSDNLVSRVIIATSLFL